VLLRRKLTVLLMAVMVMLALASGVALAADFIGTSGDDILVGTDGDDYLKGKGGNDRITPGEGVDEVYAGAGDDLIYARDSSGTYDYIDCGGGFDWVETIHRDDVTLGNCERAWGPRKGDIPR